MNPIMSFFLYVIFLVVQTYLRGRTSYLKGRVDLPDGYPDGDQVIFSHTFSLT